MEGLNSKIKIFKVADPLKLNKLYLTIYSCNNLLILKKNLFDSNKYLFGPKIFCLNQTNVI